MVSHKGAEITEKDEVSKTDWWKRALSKEGLARRAPIGNSKDLTQLQKNRLKKTRSLAAPRCDFI